MKDIVIKIRGVDEISKSISSIQSKLSNFSGVLKKDIFQNLNNKFQIFTKTKKFSYLTDGFSSVSSGVQKLTDNLAGLSIVSLGVNGSMTIATKGAMDFETKMMDIKALMENIDDKAFEGMQASVKKMAFLTSYSAIEAAEGLEKIVAAGFEVKEAIGLLLPTIRMAQAGSMEFASASEILTNGVKSLKNSFANQNDEVANAITLSNMLSKGQAISTASIGDLGEALNYGAATLSTLKVPVHQIIASLAVLADSGQKGSKGGTVLTSMFSELLNPAEKARKVLARLGLSVKNLPMSDIPKLIATLNKSFNKIHDPIKRARYNFILFGEQGQRAFSALSQSGDENLQKVSDAIKRATNDTDRIANLKSQTFAYLFKQITNQILLLKNELGTIFTSEQALGGPFKKLLLYLQDLSVAFINVNSKQELFGQLTPRQQKFAIFVNDFRVGLLEAITNISKALEGIYLQFKETFAFFNIDISKGKFWGQIAIFTVALVNLAVIFGALNLVLSPFIAIFAGIAKFSLGLANGIYFLCTKILPLTFPLLSKLAMTLATVILPNFGLILGTISAITAGILVGVKAYEAITNRINKKRVIYENIIISGVNVIPTLQDVISDDFKTPFKYKLDNKSELKNYVIRKDEFKLKVDFNNVPKNVDIKNESKSDRLNLEIGKTMGF